MKWSWAALVGTWSRVGGYILLLAENWGQPTNLGSESRANMLRLVRDELFYAGHDIVEKSLALKQRAKAWWRRLA